MQNTDVLFEERGGLGLITLNRPKALNALTADMTVQIYEALLSWDKDDSVKAVAVVGAGDKAFCAGGDVVRVSKSYQAGTNEWQKFFFNEYRMNVAIDQFSKPYVSFVDGITMGGGVGVSIPGDFWVATEKTLFAMPETGLGLFPDVGGGWFLPRLEGSVGVYLALTGARLKAADLYEIGVATHVVQSALVETIIDDLTGIGCGADVKAILDTYHGAAEKAPIQEAVNQISMYFSGPSVEAIIVGLEKDQSDWCQKQAKILASKSPTSLKLTFEQLLRGKKARSFSDNMQMEYRMVNHVMNGADFFEGVRAILIDKDQTPKWQPHRLADVSDDYIQGHFSPLEKGTELLDQI